jgi:hypothetical protein
MSHDSRLPWEQRECKNRITVGRGVSCVVHTEAIYRVLLMKLLDFSRKMTICLPLNIQQLQICKSAIHKYSLLRGPQCETEHVCFLTVWEESVPSIVRMIKSRRMRWAGHVARMGEKRNAYRILAGKSEGKRPLGRSRRRCVDNIKLDIREDGMVWIGLIWLRIWTSGGLL